MIAIGWFSLGLGAIMGVYAIIGTRYETKHGICDWGWKV